MSRCQQRVFAARHIAADGIDRDIAVAEHHAGRAPDALGVRAAVGDGVEHALHRGVVVGVHPGARVVCHEPRDAAH